VTANPVPVLLRCSLERMGKSLSSSRALSAHGHSRACTVPVMSDSSSSTQSGSDFLSARSPGKSRLTFQAAAIAGGWVPLTIAAGQGVALQMDTLNASAAAYSLLIAAGWGLSMVALPVMGHLGDTVVRRGIDRRILIVLGGLAMLACFAVMGVANTMLGFAAIWLLAQFPTALIVTAASSRLANEAPADLRFWASTAAGIGPVIALMLGAATTLILSDIPSVLFIAPAVVGCVLLIPSLIMDPLPVGETATRPVNRSQRSYPWVFLFSIALAFSGLAVGRIYLVPLIELVSTDLSTERVTATASITLLVATFGALIGALVAGRLMQRGDRHLTIFRWSALSSAIPLSLLAIASNVEQVIAIGAVLGICLGAVSVSIYGIYLNKFSHQVDSGRTFGLIVAAETVPYAALPLAAAIFQTATSSALIPILFTCGALLSISAGFLTRVRMRRGW
jgi:MFS family permease